MTGDERPQVTANAEVEEMLAELEGRDANTERPQASAFPSSFQARGLKQAPRWPAGFTAMGIKAAPPPRWTARFIASGAKPAR